MRDGRMATLAQPLYLNQGRRMHPALLALVLVLGLVLALVLVTVLVLALVRQTSVQLQA